MKQVPRSEISTKHSWGSPLRHYLNEDGRRDDGGTPSARRAPRHYPPSSAVAVPHRRGRDPFHLAVAAQKYLTPSPILDDLGLARVDQIVDSRDLL